MDTAGYRKHWNKGIRFRMLVFGVTIAVVPIMFFGLYSMLTARTHLEESIHKQHAMVATRLAHETTDLVATLLTSLETMAMAESARLINEPQAVRERLLYTLLNRYPYIENLSVIGSEGEELTKVSRRYAIGPNDLLRTGSHSFFSGISAGGNYVGNARLERDNQVVFTIAVPLPQSPGGKFQGAMVAEVSLRSIMERITSTPTGEGGYIFLVDEQGKLIGHEDFGQVVQKLDVSASKAVQELQAGKGGEATPVPIRYISYTGQEVLGVYTRIAATNWGVVIERPTATVYGPLLELIFRLAAVMVAVMAVAVITSILFALYITRPLNSLVDGAKKVAGGDLAYRIPRLRDDELGQVIDAFNEMTGELQRRRDLELSIFQTEKMAAVGMLAAGVAHEINNPLNTLKFYTTDLKERMGAESLEELQAHGELLHYLNTMQDQINRCTAITQSLLNFARPQSERLEQVDLPAVIAETLSLIRYPLRKQGVDIITTIPDNLPCITANAAQLQQVFLNILTNGLDAMPQGGSITICGEVDKEKTPPVVRVTIKDTGSGIPEDQLGKIFQPFYSTKPVGQGTGLGLSICYGIISRLRGLIRVESEISTGTTVTIELPINER